MKNLDEKQQHLSILEDVITKRKESLNKYVLNSNAKKFYVDKLNVEIAELTQVFNFFNNQDFSEFWNKIEVEIKELEDLDPQISGVNILLTKNSGNGHFANLSIKMSNGL